MVFGAVTVGDEKCLLAYYMLSGLYVLVLILPRISHSGAEL